jgi:ribosomal protein L37AE/L43A
VARQRQATTEMKRKNVVCSRCKGAIRARDARCVVSGLWLCARCVYELDHPGRLTAPARITPRVRLQHERLFGIAQYGR